MNQARKKFQGLVKRLQTCPSLDTSINHKLFFEVWTCFRQINPEQGDEITRAMIVAIILFDEESFGSLLTNAEFTQLAAIARQGLDRYQSKTNPLNQPGKLLAASIKEST